MRNTNDIPAKVTLPSGHKANRAKAEELREAYRLQHQMEAKEARRVSAPKPKPGQRQLFDPAELETKKAGLADLSGDNQKALRKIFEKLGEEGPFRSVAQAPAPEVLDILLKDFPNFAAVTKSIQKHLLLCRLGAEKLLKIPAILVNGPPGIGKTAYCSRLAKLLGIRFEQIDLSAGGATFTMTGLDSGYNSGHPGRIWESLQQGSLSVLWQLDELEKCNQEGRDRGNQYLLGLLEPSTAERFIDNSTLLPLNASWVFYIATSNVKELMDEPLLSRFEVFDIEAPQGAQLKAVVTSIHRGLLESEPWAQTFDDHLDESLIDALSTYSPREIRRHLINACASAAADGRNYLLATDVSSPTESPGASVRRIGFI